VTQKVISCEINDSYFEVQLYFMHVFSLKVKHTYIQMIWLDTW